MQSYSHECPDAETTISKEHAIHVANKCFHGYLKHSVNTHAYLD